MSPTLCSRGAVLSKLLVMQDELQAAGGRISSYPNRLDLLKDRDTVRARLSVSPPSEG
jgi:hypothetical protein